MKPQPVTCHNCGHSMEYWTIRSFINCTNCRAEIAVEPCIEPLEQESTEIDEVTEDGVGV